MMEEKEKCDGCTDCTCNEGQEKEKEQQKSLSDERISAIGKEFFDAIVKTETMNKFQTMCEAAAEELKNSEKTEEAYRKVLLKLTKDKLYFTNIIIKSEKIYELIPELMDPYHASYLMPSLVKMLMSIFTEAATNVAKVYEEAFPYNVESEFAYNDLSTTFDDMLTGKYDLLHEKNGEAAIMMLNSILEASINDINRELSYRHQHLQITSGSVDKISNTINQMTTDFFKEFEKIDYVKEALDKFKNNNRGEQ